MNKKERIIIDGIDVTDCNFIITPKKQCPAKSMPYAKEASCIGCKEHNTIHNFCKNNPNCYYKQLQMMKTLENKNRHKIITNYIKIKNMTVDEMAEVFNRKFCEECGYKETDFVNWKDCDANCWANIQNGYYKKWLLEEATESEKK